MLERASAGSGGAGRAARRETVAAEQRCLLGMTRRNPSRYTRTLLLGINRLAAQIAGACALCLDFVGVGGA